MVYISQRSTDIHAQSLCQASHIKACFKKTRINAKKGNTWNIMWIRKGHLLCSVNKYTNFNNELPSLCMHVQIWKKIPTDTENIHKQIYGFDDGLKSAYMHIVHVSLCIFYADTMLKYQQFHVLMMWELEFPDTTLLALFRLNFPFCMYEWTHFVISTKLNKNQVIVSLYEEKNNTKGL